MKYQTTKKAVMNGYNNVISVGYCNLQNLLDYQTPVAYTAGAYGWNADVYDFGAGTVIVTGYRPFGKFKPGYDLCRKYDKLAEGKTNAERERLLSEFMTEVCGNGAENR